MATGSIHIWKAMEKARRLGAYAGNAEAAGLWDYSKRELVEIALRLAELCADDPSPEAIVRRVVEERDALRANGIL